MRNNSSNNSLAGLRKQVIVMITIALIIKVITIITTITIPLIVVIMMTLLMLIFNPHLHLKNILINNNNNCI